MKMARYLATTRSRFGRGRRLLQAEYVNRSDVRSAGNSRSQKSRSRVELRAARVANCDDCDARRGNNGLMKMPEDDDAAAAEEEREKHWRHDRLESAMLGRQRQTLRA